MKALSAIFSTISVIEDRREGFLQGVLVAPVPRSAVAGGPAWLGWLMRVNPFSYGVAALRHAFDPSIAPQASAGLLPGMAGSVAILSLTALAAFLLVLAAIHPRRTS